MIYFGGDAPASTGQLLDALFEFCKRRIRPVDFTTNDGKAQEAGLIDFGNLAFGLVNLELELGIEKAKSLGNLIEFV